MSTLSRSTLPRVSRRITLFFLIAGLFGGAGLGSAADLDRDGLDDALEQQLALRHAPVVYLHPSEWNYPANVEWFLDRARLRFHHSCSALALCCGDHQLLNYGDPNQQNLITQAHGKRSWSLFKGCHHTSTQYSDRSWDNDHHFFLQLQDDDHSGSLYPFEWKVYVHSYPNNLGGINLQYWFFYAYNDGILVANHEGDWENIVVELNASQGVVDVLFARHNDPYHRLTNVTWHEGTHPVILSALGTHASYESFDSCADTGIFTEHGCAWGHPAWRWFTWSGGLPAGEAGYQGGGLVMVGEKDFPLNGQNFLRYSGRWGEIGSTPFTDGTDGPRGPAYQGKWNFARASSGGGGSGSGGGECPPEAILEECDELE